MKFRRLTGYKEVEKYVVAAFILVCGLVVTSNMDFEDAIQQERLYCENVKEGVHPDYDNLYNKVCKKYEKAVDNETVNGLILNSQSGEIKF